MVNQKQKVNWGLRRRIGLALILVAISSTVVYYYLPPNSSRNIINPSNIEQNSIIRPIYILLNQRNQFLSIGSVCISCNESIVLNISIFLIQNNNFQKNSTIQNFSFNFNKSMKNSISLNPATYIIGIKLEGNFSARLDLSGFGIPYYFIATQGLLLVIGTILIIIDRIKYPT